MQRFPPILLLILATAEQAHSGAHASRRYPLIRDNSVRSESWRMKSWLSGKR